MTQPKRSLNKAIHHIGNQINQAHTQHLSDEQIVDFQDGILDQDQRESVEAHLSVCPQCMAQYRLLETPLDFDTATPKSLEAPAPNPVSASAVGPWKRWSSSSPLMSIAAAILFASGIGLGLFFQTTQPNQMTVNPRAPVNLLPGNTSILRGGDPSQQEHGQEIRIPPKAEARFLTLLLDLPFFNQTSEGDSDFSLVLARVDVDPPREVWHGTGTLPQNAESLVIDLPTESLTPGSFQILLRGQAGESKLFESEYHFNINR